MTDTPFERTIIGDPWPRLETKDYDVRTEEAARATLARVAASGSPKEKAAVRAAVQRFWPNIGKIGKSNRPRDMYPNSNMKD